MAQRRRKRRIDPDVLAEHERLTREGFSGVRIFEMLHQQYGPRAPQSLRTVQDMMRDVLPEVPDTSGSWSAGKADADDAALVLPVIGELLHREIADRISNDLASMLVKIRTVAPAMPLHAAYQMAMRYLMAATSGAETKWLDAYMALECWRSPLMERGAISAEMIPANWWYVGPKAPKEGTPND